MVLPTPVDPPSPSNVNGDALVRAPDLSHPRPKTFETLTKSEYAELRAIAQRILKNRRAPGSPQATSLVHSAWITLQRPSVKPPADTHFGHAMVARAMRSLLVDEARRRVALKRAPENQGLPLDSAVDVADPSIDSMADDQWIRLDEALTRLAVFDERMARIVELRFFRGLEVPETADVLGISAATVKRDWRLARAWLIRELGTDEALLE